MTWKHSQSVSINNHNLISIYKRECRVSIFMVPEKAEELHKIFFFTLFCIQNLSYEPNYPWAVHFIIWTWSQNHCLLCHLQDPDVRFSSLAEIPLRSRPALPVMASCGSESPLLPVENQSAALWVRFVLRSAPHQKETDEVDLIRKPNTE